MHPSRVIVRMIDGSEVCYDLDLTGETHSAINVETTNHVEAVDDGRACVSYRPTGLRDVVIRMQNVKAHAPDTSDKAS